jgi:hypothetical protein
VLNSFFLFLNILENYYVFSHTLQNTFFPDINFVVFILLVSKGPFLLFLNKIEFNSFRFLRVNNTVLDVHKLVSLINTIRKNILISSVQLLNCSYLVYYEPHSWLFVSLKKTL